MKRITYILVIDILGYEKLAKDISKKTDLETSHIRRFYILDPLNQVLSTFQNKIRYRPLTDSFLVYVYEQETIFQIIKQLSEISIPFNNPITVPLEIGLAKAELDDDIDPLHQDETVEILKSNLLKYYRDYYRKKTGKSVLTTFIVTTKDFYNSLPEDRRYLCKKIDYTTDKESNVEFYVAELKMMRDVSGRGINDIAKIKKFLDKVQIDDLWEYFELKALIFRDVEAGRWITQFIYIRLLDEPVTEYTLRTNNLILIHKSYSRTELHSVLDSATGDEFHVRDFPSSSLANIDEHMEYHFCGYINNYRIRSPADMFEVTSPSHILLKGGRSFSKLSDSEISILQDLQDYDQQSPIIDAIQRHLNLNFWNFAYSAFLVAIAPLPMQKPRITFNNNQIEIRIRCADNIDPLGLEVRIIGKRGNNNTNLGTRDNNFVRVDRDMVYNANLTVTEEDGVVIDLYYNRNQFENCFVKRGLI